MLNFNKELTALDISDQLCNLGIVNGDVLYLKARFNAVGLIQPDVKINLIKGIMDVIGNDGLLFVPSFTSASRRWSKNKIIFNQHSEPNSGVLAKAVLQTPGAIRSSHPTHSFAALGSRAKEFLWDHDEKKHAFYPIRHLINVDAKMLLVGCNMENPGFPTVHYAQNELGLSQKHLTKYFSSVLLENINGLQLWCPNEDPGCSLGFDKLYKNYILDENFKTGYFGNAYSIIVRAGAAYRTEKKILQDDPLAVICDRPYCISCKILRSYNKRAAPMGLLYWLKKTYFST